MRDARNELTRRWLDRISARVSLEADRVFPTHELLDHVPILVDGIASYVENPAEDIGSDAPVIAKAMELGELRHSQGFDAYEIFKEYEILGSILFHFLASVADDIPLPCTRREMLHCGHRVFEAVALIQQATSMQFLRKTQARVRDREDRLRGFNRMVTHELKNRVGTITGAVAMLEEAWIGDAERRKFVGMAAENVDALRQVLDDLSSLSHLDEDLRQQRNIQLREAVAEVRRRLREFARDRGVAVEIEEPLPVMEVNAAAVELCLTNYVSNALKYSDPAKPRRWVRVSAEQTTGDGKPGALIVRVQDNGLGIPDAARDKLFQRFFRAHADTATDVEGTGLGLSIVRETVEDLGGRAWAEPAADGKGGSTFAFSIPATRKSDAKGAAPSADAAVTGSRTAR